MTPSAFVAVKRSLLVDLFRARQHIISHHCQTDLQYYEGVRDTLESLLRQLGIDDTGDDPVYDPSWDVDPEAAIDAYCDREGLAMKTRIDAITTLGE